MKNHNTHFVKILNPENGMTGGIIYAKGETFVFTAKIGEWVNVEWLDDNDHSYKKNEHRSATAFATQNLITKYKRIA